MLWDQRKDWSVGQWARGPSLWCPFFQGPGHATSSRSWVGRSFATSHLLARTQWPSKLNRLWNNHQKKITKYDQAFYWHVSASMTECTRMCQTFLSALGSWDSHKTMSLIKLRHFVLTVATIRICACIILDWRTGKIWKWGNKCGTGLHKRTPSPAHCSRRSKNWTLHGLLLYQ